MKLLLPPDLQLPSVWQVHERAFLELNSPTIIRFLNELSLQEAFRRADVLGVEINTETSPFREIKQVPKRLALSAWAASRSDLVLPSDIRPNPECLVRISQMICTMYHCFIHDEEVQLYRFQEIEGRFIIGRQAT